MEKDSFESMFEKSYVDFDRFEPGQKIEARVVKITSDHIFIDIGRKGEGVIDRREFEDEGGKLPFTEGQNIDVYFRGSSGGEMRFTSRIGRGNANSAQLEEAWRNQIPVEGYVEKEIKGGYEVKLASTIRSFCPYSQMGLNRAEAATHIGNRYNFIITDYSEKGRNIIVSNRLIEQEKADKEKEAKRSSLSVGMAVRGKVRNIKEFGAFVDLGGIDGMIPVSEISWGQVDKVEDVLSLGQEVETVIMAIDWSRDRITLSLRKALDDPWDSVMSKYPEGSRVKGTVTRIQPFGAFIALEDGIEGLIHVSKLGRNAGKRIKHPREVCSKGDVLEIIVESVTPSERRISLTMDEFVAPVTEDVPKGENPEDWAKEYVPVKEKQSEGLGSFGELFKASLEGKSKPRK
ncbi:S1 RNA-binding domain-containing protein [Myxococcota bacterium]|nr:S1 RNA-binding domain-containing protein [Myxococcota bacterium]MBU1380121.1 S1 RNA-binding domain-containing protein [Myxococcota bacterium]MBU1497141.1 S1 RNA-binding domain-containing protein [Myxococcota bacterium]